MSKPVTAYLGVPYAGPPTDSYRLRTPSELSKPHWNITYNAVHLVGACPQIIRTMGFAPYDDSNPKNGTNERCLKFNMWVPKDKTNMPVLIFLHGGSFTVRTASVDKFNGSVLAATTESIVITANFRLGFFGFAYLNSGVIPGNMGLLDQQMLLKWVHTAINSFGGDKDRVTIFGTSSGSSSVAAHLLSEGSKPYFKRAIMSSGTITHFMSTVSEEIADANTRNVSRIVGCEENEDKTKKSDEDILKCLQTKSVEDLLDAAKKVRAQGQFPTPFPFMPVNNDTVFFKGSIKDKMKNINKDVDIMLGRTADEGTFFMITGFTNNSLFGCQFYPHLPITDQKNECNMSENNFKALVKFGGKMLRFNDTEVEKLKDIYEKSANTYTNRSIRLLSDFVFDCELSRFGIDYSNISQKSVYFYDHTRRSPINKWPSWTGAMHGDDITDIFGTPFRHPEKYPKEILQKEQDYSKKVMTAIGKFMKDGNPSDKWKKGTGDAPDALALDGELNFDTTTNFVKFRPTTCDEFDKLMKGSIMWKMQQAKLAASKEKKA